MTEKQVRAIPWDGLEYQVKGLHIIWLAMGADGHGGWRQKRNGLIDVSRRPL